MTPTLWYYILWTTINIWEITSVGIIFKELIGLLQLLLRTYADAQIYQIYILWFYTLLFGHKVSVILAFSRYILNKCEARWWEGVAVLSLSVCDTATLHKSVGKVGVYVLIPF